MKSRSIALLSVAVAGACLAAPVTRADYISACADLGAIDNPGLAPIGIFGKCLGGFFDTGFQNTPFETAGTGYDYTNPSGETAAAGESTDFHWIHTTGGPFNDPSTGAKFAWPISGQDFIVHPSIDHTPLPEESLEVTLWGSNDGTSWVRGTLVEVYEMGWNADSIEDDGSNRWVFDVPVSMISMTSGLAQGDYLYASDDAEVDAVTLAPAPGAATIGTLGALTSLRRRRA